MLELALNDTIALYSSPVLVDELSQTLHYAKLTKRITALQTTTQALVEHYSAMVTLVVTLQVPGVIAQDADDDQHREQLDQVLVVDPALHSQRTLSGRGQHQHRVQPDIRPPVIRQDIAELDRPVQVRPRHAPRRAGQSQ